MFNDLVMECRQTFLNGIKCRCKTKIVTDLSKYPYMKTIVKN